MSPSSHSKATQILFIVLVYIFSFALSLRTVLLSMPHFSRSQYVETPFFSIVTHNLSNEIISYLDLEMHGQAGFVAEFDFAFDEGA